MTGAAFAAEGVGQLEGQGFVVDVVIGQGEAPGAEAEFRQPAGECLEAGIRVVEIPPEAFPGAGAQVAGMGAEVRGAPEGTSGFKQAGGQIISVDAEAIARDFGGGHGGTFGRGVVRHDRFIEVEYEGGEGQGATFRVGVGSQSKDCSGACAPLE